MPRISPFVGLCFDRSRVGDLERVTAPPYDVISSEDHARFLSTSRYNVIRLDLGRDPAHPRSAQRYAQAADDLAAWRDEHALIPTRSAAYYVYEMEFALHGRSRRVRGLVCAVRLEALGGDIVPHERTMPGPVEDRLQLLRALEVNLSCVYSVFPGPSRELAAWLEEMACGDPNAELTDEDGVHHRMWICPPEPAIGDWLRGQRMMIADGHHRYATALRYRDEMRARRGPGPWDEVMMFLVDGRVEDPPVLPFHRVQLRGETRKEGDRVHNLEEVLESVDDDELLVGAAAHEDGALVHRVIRLEGSPPAVSRLHERALAGLDDALGFTPDAVAAEEAVRGGGAVAAYFLPPTNAATIRSVVDVGGKLPPKSTFFWPKPRTGVVLRPHGTA